MITHIIATAQAKGLFYQLKKYDFRMERQRVAYAEFVTAEPMEVGLNFIFSIGERESIEEKAILEVTRCDLIEEEWYEIEAVSPVAKILRSPFHLQLSLVNAGQILMEMAKRLGLKFEDQTGKQWNRPHTVRFISTVRNALDQIALIYRLEKERVDFDLFNQNLILIDQCINETAIPLPDSLFIAEESGELEMLTASSMRPYLKLLWLDEELIIDRVRFIGDDDEQSMFLSF